MNTSIALYAMRELHVPVLIPLFHALRRAGFQDIAFYAPPFHAGEERIPEEGLRPETIAKLEASGMPFRGIAPLTPVGCVVTADACYDRVEGWGPAVCVGHGTISKNIFFIDEPVCLRENYATVMCVPGPWYVGSYGKWVGTHVIPTGFTKMDEMAQDYALFRTRYLAASGFRTDRHTILFAPTYNPELTGMEILFRAWEQLDPARWQVLVKLHGAASEEWREAYRKLCARQENLHYVEEAALAPFIAMSDLMVSDLSSAYVEYLITGKPLVLVDNPLMADAPFCNPKAVEFQVRDAGYRVDTAERFLRVVEQLRPVLPMLPNPLDAGAARATKDPLAETRRRRAAELFPALDGHNSDRVAQVVRDLLEGTLSRVPPFASALEIVVPPKITDRNALLHNIARREWDAPVWLLGNPASSHAAGAATGKTGAEATGINVQQPLVNLPGATLLPEGTLPRRPFILLDGATTLPVQWDRIWSISRLCDDRFSLTGPLRSDECLPAPQNWSTLLESEPPTVWDQLPRLMKFQMCHRAAPLDALGVDGLVVREDVPESFVRLLLEWARSDGTPAGFRALLRTAPPRKGGGPLLSGITFGLLARPGACSEPPRPQDGYPM